MQRLNKAFDKVAKDLEREGDRMGQKIRLRNGGARLTLGELLDHLRPGQVMRGLAGIMWNTLLYPFVKGRLHDELRTLEMTMNVILARAGEPAIQLNALDVRGLQMFWDFGKSLDGVTSVNPRLAWGMKLLTALHETLHATHPEWSESQVIAKTKEAASFRSALNAGRQAILQGIQAIAGSA